MARGGLNRINGNWKAALSDFDKVAMLEPFHSTIAFHRGRLLFEAGRFQDAHGNLNEFLAKNPNHIQGLLTRARCLGDLHQPLLAARDYSQAIAQVQKPVPILFLEKADALVTGGEKNIAAAIDTLDDGIVQLGPLIILQSRAIDLEIQARRYDAALKRIEQVLSQTQRKERWLARRGEVLEQAGWKTKAHAAHTEALLVIDKLPGRLKQTNALKELTTRLERYLGHSLDGNRKNKKDTGVDDSIMFKHQF